MGPTAENDPVPKRLQMTQGEYFLDRSPLSFKSLVSATISRQA